MENLQKKLEGMLKGEKKRREIAIKWFHEVTKVLKVVIPELYGDMGTYISDPNYAISVWKIDNDNKKENLSLYFRYAAHTSANGNEYPGFYVEALNGYGLYWGLESTKGVEFWIAIKNIINWLPLLEKDIEKRSKIRENIVSKLVKVKI